jgi:hypothetical protein
MVKGAHRTGAERDGDDFRNDVYRCAPHNLEIKRPRHPCLIGKRTRLACESERNLRGECSSVDSEIELELSEHALS